MASFLTGAQISAPMTLKAPYGIDSRSTANTVEEVLTQYPASCRYLGMKVFIEAENKFYIFSKHDLGDGTTTTGLTDDDFRPYESQIDVDNVLSDTSQNPVEIRIITGQLNTLQKKLVVGENLDDELSEESENPITAKGVYNALKSVRGELTYRGYYPDRASLDAITGVVVNDFVTVESDEDFGNQKTKYIYGTIDDEGNLGWVFGGYLGSTEVQINDDGISNSEVWSSEKVNEEIMKQHQSYQAGISLVAGEMYIESHSLYRCLVDVSSDENLAFTLLPDGTMELVIGNGDIKQCEYDEPTETLYLNKLTMDSIEYNEATQTINIFET